jgi:hypothetical protein
MDSERRAQLEAKKAELREELQQKELRDRIAAQIAHLEQIGQPFHVYYRYEHLHWINTHVQVRKRDGYTGIHGDFQIDVNDGEARIKKEMNEADLDAKTFQAAFLSVIPADISLIVCHQGGAPELELSVHAFLSRPSLFFSQPETWIITSDKNWIIEYIWEQGVVRFIELEQSLPKLAKLFSIQYE